MEFNRQALQEAGFEGFVPLQRLDHVSVPAGGGVYVVLRDADQPPRFLESSCGGHFKGRNPAVPVEALTGKWVPSCAVLYIGKATSLKSRLRQYRDFGCGKPVGHWGGRYLWQLADASELLVCWKLTEEVPRSAEQLLLNEFRGRFGRLPFANLVS
jgi:hypothetical protein